MDSTGSRPGATSHGRRIRSTTKSVEVREQRLVVRQGTTIPADAYNVEQRAAGFVSYKVRRPTEVRRTSESSPVGEITLPSERKRPEESRRVATHEQ